MSIESSRCTHGIHEAIKGGIDSSEFWSGNQRAHRKLRIFERTGLVRLRRSIVCRRVFVRRVAALTVAFAETTVYSASRDASIVQMANPKEFLDDLVIVLRVRERKGRSRLADARAQRRAGRAFHGDHRARTRRRVAGGRGTGSATACCNGGIDSESNAYRYGKDWRCVPRCRFRGRSRSYRSARDRRRCPLGTSRRKVRSRVPERSSDGKSFSGQFYIEYFHIVDAS